MHGYTHQYSNMRNKYTGVSGDDYEFWNIVTNAPVAEDSTAWALGRLNAGKTELTSNGYTPVAWENAPHYHASALASKAMPQVFPTTYQRVVYSRPTSPTSTPPSTRTLASDRYFPT